MSHQTSPATSQASTSAASIEQDRTFLKTIIDVYAGGPVGIEAVAATMGEERDTLEDVIEPYLLQQAWSRARVRAAAQRRSRMNTSG